MSNCAPDLLSESSGGARPAVLDNYRSALKPTVGWLVSPRNKVLERTQSLFVSQN
jgi:hypothetical protein